MNKKSSEISTLNYYHSSLYKQTNTTGKSIVARVVIHTRPLFLHKDPHVCSISLYFQHRQFNVISCWVTIKHVLLLSYILFS